MRSKAHDLNVIVFSHILKDKCELKCHPEWVKIEAPIDRLDDLKSGQEQSYPWENQVIVLPAFEDNIPSISTPLLPLHQSLHCASTVIWAPVSWISSVFFTHMDFFFFLRRDTIFLFDQYSNLFHRVQVRAT